MAREWTSPLRRGCLGPERERERFVRVDTTVTQPCEQRLLRVQMTPRKAMMRDPMRSLLFPGLVNAERGGHPPRSTRTTSYRVLP